MKTLRFGLADAGFELETTWQALYQFFERYTARFPAADASRFFYKASPQPVPTLQRVDISAASDDESHPPQESSDCYRRDIDLYPMLENMILKDLLRVLASRYPVYHAAVTAHNGEATLFLGESNAGKSTLCVERVRAGHLYLSDEMAAVDDDHVIAVPRPIGFNTLENPEHLMPRGNDRFDAFGYDFVDPSGQFRQAEFYLPIPEISAVAGARFPIKEVIWLEPVKNGAPWQKILDGPTKRARLALSRFSAEKFC